ncbi:hypothetical protein HDU79_005346, partial [Rhizoclosmatium sp. JEL0117]
LRQGHGYIVPESKGKSGPSPVYVVEAQDGLLPAHTSVGQLASQRTAAPPPRPLALKPHLSVSPVCPAQILFNPGHLQSQPLISHTPNNMTEHQPAFYPAEQPPLHQSKNT